MGLKRVSCEACKFGRNPKCHECRGLGYIEYDDGTCAHLPPMNISYEAMCDGWMCPCGASGPWTKQYDKDYEKALKQK